MDRLGKLSKKKKTTTKLDYGVSHEDEKTDDLPLSKMLKAPHFYRCRNHVFTYMVFICFLGGNKAVQFNRSAHGLCPQCRHRRIRKSDHLVEAELQLWQKVLSGHSQPTGPTGPTDLKNRTGTRRFV